MQTRRDRVSSPCKGRWGAGRMPDELRSSDSFELQEPPGSVVFDDFAAESTTCGRFRCVRPVCGGSLRCSDTEANASEPAKQAMAHERRSRSDRSWKDSKFRYSSRSFTSSYDNFCLVSIDRPLDWLVGIFWQAEKFPRR